MIYPRVKLKNHIDVLSGFAFKSKDFTNTGVPVIKIKNVTPPAVTLDDLSYVSKEIAQTQNRFLLNYNDVLIALTGSHINQMASVVGRVARVRYHTPSLLNQRVGKITVINPDETDLNYIYYYLSQDTVKIQLASKAGGAANQANISPSDVKDLCIPFPNIDVQRRIAGILSAYDNLIENNQKQIKLLEEAAQRLYKEWFVDLRFPGYENTPIVDGVPDGWAFGELCDIAIDSGKKEKKEHREQYQYYLPIDCLPKRSLAYIDKNDITLAESSLVAFMPNDILFGAMRPYFHKVVMARDKGLTRTTCFVINSKAPAYWAYLLLLLFSKDTVDYATKISVGTTMPYVRWKDFTHMPTLIPPEEICDAFQAIVLPIIERTSCLAVSCERLIQARDRLLPKLMSGEIEV